MREPGIWETLAEADEEIVSRMLERIPEDLELVRVPREGLVLMTCLESLGGRFHLGEVHAAEALVRWRGREGYGLVVGGDERRALVAAAVDVFSENHDTDPDALAVLELMAQARGRIVERRRDEALLVDSTRVEFDLMPGA